MCGDHLLRMFIPVHIKVRQVDMKSRQRHVTRKERVQVIGEFVLTGRQQAKMNLKHQKIKLKQQIISNNRTTGFQVPT